MANSGKEELGKVNTISCLRLLFVCLSVGCLLQIARETGSILPGCENVYYKGDGEYSSNLRPLDPDAPFGASSREAIPKMVPDPLFRQEQERIDYGMNDTSRCAQYGVESLPDHKKHQRRIFFGSMLANENPEVIIAHAIEAYNKFSVVALVESNTTHSGEPRTMHYGPGSMAARELQESELFGTANHTKVVVDYWLEDMPDVVMMSREVEQRNEIWKIWVDQGMTERDVGLMADLDEVVSRDFLNAIQVCDFPKLRYNPEKRAQCAAPKMILSTMQFEASPLCVKKNEWFHPDLILGSCILGVGDPSGRVTPERTHRAPGHDSKTVGHRTGEWGMHDSKKYPQDVIENDRIPLWDGRDIRETHGSNENLLNYVDAHKNGHGKTAVFGTAYHLHNWFKDMEVLRDKFATYGHADSDARTTPLSKMEGDVNLLVRCARSLGNDVTGKGAPKTLDEYYENNELLPKGMEGGKIFSLGGNRPIYFQNRTYVEERHTLLQEIVRADEGKHGTVYNQT